MKKFLLSLVIGAFICAGASSCNKCGHCEINGVSGVKYCQKDDKTTYDNYQSSCTTGGGTWVND